MYPRCQEWFHPRPDQRANANLRNEATLSSANTELVVTGLLLLPPRPPGFPGPDVHQTRTSVHWSVLKDLQEERRE